jgi:hypothetical protein
MSLAFLDGLNYLFYLWDVTEEDIRYRNYRSAEDAHVVRHFDKEKVYKTERNLYLSGFAIALLFAIGRLTDLMQEHAELEHELEKMRLLISPAVESSNEDSRSDKEIEMNPIQSKKTD